MRHLRFGSKSLFVGDEAAETLVDYGALIAQTRGGDRIDLLGFSAEGNRITTTFLLNSGTDLVVESTNLPFDEVDNEAAVEYMREKIRGLEISPDFVIGFRAFNGEQV
jgi:hypothetical protein